MPRTRKEKFNANGKPMGKKKIKYTKKPITITIDHDLYQITRSIYNVSDFFTEAAKEFLLTRKFQEYVLKDEHEQITNKKAD